MKKRNILIIIGIGIIIIGGWLIFPNQVEKFPSPEEIETPQESIQESIKQEVILIIDDDEELPKTFEAEFKEGMTAFDLLKEGVSKLDLVLKTKSYDIGIFIEAIGDKENGQEEKYWLYYVNEEMPMVAADKKEIRTGDRVEFRFEKSLF